MKFRRWAVLLLCLALRLIKIDADPPPWLSWSTGLYTDEGFYTLDARHAVLFGTPAPGTFHDRLLSPLLSWLQQGVFTLFGTGIVQARLLSVAFGILTVIVFWLGLRRAYGMRAADIGAVFLGLSPVFALYNRTALQETPTVFWLVLAFACWAYAGSSSGRLQWMFYAAAGSFVGIAVVLKSLAGLAVPVLLAKVSKSTVYFGFGGVLALYAIFWYLPHHAELSRMTTYYRVHQIQPHSLLGLRLNLKRGLIQGEHGVLPYLLATLPVPCLLAVWAVWRRREWTSSDRFLAYWLAGGLLFCFVSSYAPSRYYVLFLPALIGLAARTFGALNRTLRIAAVGVFLVTSAVWYGVTWHEQSFAQRDARQALARMLPKDSIVIGDFAPTLCLGTHFPATTVQPGLANDDRPVERLRATHIMVVRNAANWQTWWRGYYPEIMQPSHKIGSFEFGGLRHFIVDVYSVKAL